MAFNPISRLDCTENDAEEGCPGEELEEPTRVDFRVFNDAEAVLQHVLFDVCG